MNSKNSSFQNVIYLRFTVVFNVYAQESRIIEGYMDISFSLSFSVFIVAKSLMSEHYYHHHHDHRYYYYYRYNITFILSHFLSFLYKSTIDLFISNIFAFIHKWTLSSPFLFRR